MKPFKKIGEALLGLAPNLATALGGAAGGPVGASLARAAVSVVGDKLGLEEQLAADPDEVLAALNVATPEQLAAIRRGDQEFQSKMREHDLDEERIHAGDRASARNLQAVTRAWVPGVVGVTVFIGFFGILTTLIFHDPPDSADDILKIMLGSLGTVLVQVTNFFFGSSRSSQSKDQMIAQMRL